MFLWDNFKIIHRDIKPENIFITDDKVVILLDFGASKKITTESPSKTQISTPNYKAPELYLG